MNALARIEPPTALAIPADHDFDASELAIFTSIPPHRHGIVALRGMVVVYATDLIGREGILEGALYVRESQHPVANMEWESWLRAEWEDPDRARRAQPRSRLATSRAVVKVMRWPKGEDRDLWALRLSSGFTDGPIHGWGLGFDLIGKVVGLYRPDGRGS